MVSNNIVCFFAQALSCQVLELMRMILKYMMIRQPVLSFLSYPKSPPYFFKFQLYPPGKQKSSVYPSFKSGTAFCRMNCIGKMFIIPCSCADMTHIYHVFNPYTVTIYFLIIIYWRIILIISSTWQESACAKKLLRQAFLLYMTIKRKLQEAAYL